VSADICNKTGKLAGDNCTDKSEKIFITRPNRENDTRWQSAADAKYMVPVDKCEECKAAPKPEEPDPGENRRHNIKTWGEYRNNIKAGEQSEIQRQNLGLIQE